MRSDPIRLLAVVLGLWGAVPAHAGSTADDLTRIEAEAAVMKARLKLLDMQAQVAAKQAELARVAPPSSRALPTVAGVDGVGRSLYASVVMENGSVVEVTQGDSLPNGMRVVSVSSSNVTVVTRNNRTVRLKPALEASAAVAVPAAALTTLPVPTAPPGAVGLSNGGAIYSLPAVRPARTGDRP